MNKTLSALGFACLCSSLVLAASTTAITILSWWGGDKGYVTIATNTMHERLAETIIFTICLAGGITYVVARERKNEI